MEKKIGYKLFRITKSRPGELFPLFVNADKAVPVGQWVDAEEGVMVDGKVKSRLGKLKYRPGWHINDNVPYVRHIGVKENAKIAYMKPNTVWCEVEYSTDTDYNEAAHNNGMIKGHFDAKKACLNYIPKNGFYRYKTSPTMLGEWIIAGEIKINRILTDDEVERLCNNAGLSALPRQNKLELSDYGLSVA
jgi:hypothetical protein